MSKKITWWQAAEILGVTRPHMLTSATDSEEFGF